MTESILENAKTLLQVADKNFMDVDWDFAQFIFDKIDCKDCPVNKEKCKTYSEMQEGKDELTEDCCCILYNWMISHNDS